MTRKRHDEFVDATKMRYALLHKRITHLEALTLLAERRSSAAAAAPAPNAAADAGGVAAVAAPSRPAMPSAPISSSAVKRPAIAFDLAAGIQAAAAARRTPSAGMPGAKPASAAQPTTPASKPGPAVATPSGVTTALLEHAMKRLKKVQQSEPAQPSASTRSVHVTPARPHRSPVTASTGQRRSAAGFLSPEILQAAKARIAQRAAERRRGPPDTALCRERKTKLAARAFAEANQPQQQPQQQLAVPAMPVEQAAAAPAQPTSGEKRQRSPEQAATSPTPTRSSPLAALMPPRSFVEAAAGGRKVQVRWRMKSSPATAPSPVPAASASSPATPRVNLVAALTTAAKPAVQRSPLAPLENVIQPAASPPCAKPSPLRAMAMKQPAQPLQPVHRPASTLPMASPGLKSPTAQGFCAADLMAGRAALRKVAAAAAANKENLPVTPGGTAHDALAAALARRFRALHGSPSSLASDSEADSPWSLA